MKKILTLILISIVIFCFAACGDSNSGNSGNSSESHNTNDYQDLLNLATTASDYDAVYELLDENDSVEFQIALANINNVIVKETLLHYPNLDAEALVTICQNPGGFDLNNRSNFDLLLNKISYANLNSEQQCRIALTNEPTIQIGLLFRGSSLDPEALVILCESSAIDPNTPAFSGYFDYAIRNLELTSNQELQILAVNEPLFIKALLQRKNLSAQCLKAICQNPCSIDFNDTPNEILLVNAIKRTPLSNEDIIEISNSVSPYIQSQLANSQNQ